MFNWLLEPLSESDRALFGSLQKVRSNPQEILKTRFKSLDCSVMELADDIAYGVHDLEDAIVVGVVNVQQWQEALDELKKQPIGLDATTYRGHQQKPIFRSTLLTQKRYRCVGKLFHHQCALENSTEFS